MKTSILKTLAAGLTCVCLAGLSDSASAQFFNSDSNTVTPSTNRLPASPYNDSANRQFQSRFPLNQQFDQRLNQRIDRRYLRTNSPDGNLPQGEYQSRQGRGAGGHCQNKQGNRCGEDGTMSERSRRSRSYESAYGRGHQMRGAMTNGYDLTNSPFADPSGSLAAGDEYRGTYDQRGTIGPRDCKDGRCDHRRHEKGNMPNSYNNFSLTRRQTPVSRYLPSRNPYLN